MKHLLSHFAVGDLVRSKENVLWTEHYMGPEYIRPEIPQGSLGIVSYVEPLEPSYYIEITWFNDRSPIPVRYTRLEVERWLKHTTKILGKASVLNDF